MTIKYYLSKLHDGQLCCSVSDGNTSEEILLEYIPDPKNWITKNQELATEDPFYFALLDVKNYIHERYNNLRNEKLSNVPNTLGQEIRQMLKGNGIEGITKNLFDIKNSKHKIPRYDEFVRAFEHYSGLTRKDFHVETVDHKIDFYTNEDEFEMETYEGRTQLLKTFIKNKSYDEIYTETHLTIWSEIYIDGGIEKKVFVPQMRKEWEEYWTRLYARIKREIGETKHLDIHKENSRKQLDRLVQEYDDVDDIIEFAHELDDSILYPLSVITMMNIFDPETCYEEYCEMEFFGGDYEWESIALNKEDENGPIFFIRPTDS